ncbi:uncharacterized protein LOC123311992 [Coccinella septempunctata]|uniref:uncharacterized protein LOC123311992 n=1 Tax=Coccinella septempunctata TaxID=41139 RepID=UPI001D06A752|nr:uncharacterized protein LOC123311992 [Coccinella septempunctata]
MLSRRKLKLRIKLVIFLCFSLFLLALYTVITYVFPQEIDRKTLLRQIEMSLASENDSLLCKPPNLPIYSPEMMKFVHDVHPIDCKLSGKNWVKCKGSICSIQEEAKIAHGKIQCVFTDILRVDDYENVDGKSTVTDDTYQLTESDVVKVVCNSLKSKWSTVLTTIRKNDTIWRESSWNKVPDEALKMNVLMFGVDSVSRNLFMRKLPQTYSYITKNLKGVVLKGYNIVGDGTPQALIPMLTGKTELELPDTRKRFQGTEFVNAYPFIWNEFKKSGYVTGYLEDMPLYGIFTYRLNGFKETPADHYMRPYYLAEQSEHKKWPKFCTANTPRHKVMTNFIKDFYKTYQAKPKFMFGFHGELSHDDYNLVGAADRDFKEFLSDLNESNLLNNTILVVFADHGHRFAEIRNTLQGKQEERLPFFSIILPPWFQKKYPKNYKYLRNNIERLATPFDVHATLKSILNISVNEGVNKNGRSISLFTEIPTNRTCSKAFIEPHWCACLTWHPLEITDPIISKLSDTLVATLNNYTAQYRNLCDVWKLHKVNWGSKLLANENLVKFKQNSDRDGFAADLSADTRVEIETYQINVELMPDGALFEASIIHRIQDDIFSVRISDISRINMYGKQARCIEDSYPHLRKFCHCRD